MENPYQSPESPFEPQPQTGELPPYPRPGRFVHHVRIVAILMMVQAALETLMGIGLIVFALMMKPQFEQMQRELEQPQMELQQMTWLMLAMYGGMGLVTLIAATLHATAGIQNYKFRSRGLGIAAAAGGLITILTCYCLPTAIGIAVYGLIVLLSREVQEAFDMVAAGHSTDEVLAHFH